MFALKMAEADGCIVSLAGFIPGTFCNRGLEAGQPRKKSIPLPLAFVVWLETRILMDAFDAVFAGAVLLCIWGSLRFSDVQHVNWALRANLARVKNMIPNHEPPNNNPITLQPCKNIHVKYRHAGISGEHVCCFMLLHCSMTAFSKASIRNQHVAWSGLGKSKICTLYGSIDSLGKGTL